MQCELAKVFFIFLKTEIYCPQRTVPEKDSQKIISIYYAAIYHSPRNTNSFANPCIYLILSKFYTL